MKHLFTLFALFLALNITYAQENTQAVIEFDSISINYGRILKGSDGLKIFKFKNVGNEPLTITRVASSCGCTVPKKPEQPIMPGETGEIEVLYDTKKLGRISKSIYVMSNASDPRITLKIKGEVVKEFPKEEPVTDQS